jgi:hypothetical protein
LREIIKKICKKNKNKIKTILNMKYSNQYSEFWITCSRNYIEQRDNKRIESNDEIERKYEDEIGNQHSHDKITKTENIIHKDCNENIKQGDEKTVSRKFYLIFKKTTLLI